MILFVLLIVALVFWTAQFRFRRRRLYELASRVPRSKHTLPVIGIAHKLSGNTEDILTYMKQFSYEAIKSDNGVMADWLNHLLYYVMVNPVDLEMVLRTCLEKDDVHRFMRQNLGNGVLFATVPFWRRRRKILLPAFKTKIIEGFTDILVEHSERITEKLGTVCESESVDLWPIVTAYSVDSVSDTMSGAKINAQMDPSSPFMACLEDSLNLVCERLFHLWLHPDWLFRFFPQYTKQKKCMQFIYGYTDEIIRKRRDDLKTEKQAESKTNNELDYKGKTFLDLLIHLSGGEKGYTDIELREEILSLNLAGADTIGISIGFSLILLAKYPDIQEKVYKEIEEIFGGSSRPLTREDLHKLYYLERVVKESLRLFPPAPFLLRKVETEITLPSGLIVPKGVGIVASIFGAHRDPKYWGPDAEHFDPDRFLPERYTLQHACSYMPFSNGPRNCVGSLYAMMSMKSAIATIIRNFKIIGEPEKGPIPSIRTKMIVTMNAIEGCCVKLEKRKLCSIKA
ncbi:cytochrome P450 4C1-like [Bicyclus anynana]|uniref:Cytochrome P450 4C1-like n=1 Tax=Bicyclus anynana TaxID=110368 RepID=A0A6J1NT46_BICAN|nr:cytochrome P450 4C1-like [Bicyclus anynana]